MAATMNSIRCRVLKVMKNYKRMRWITSTKLDLIQNYTFSHFAREFRNKNNRWVFRNSPIFVGTLSFLGLFKKTETSKEQEEEDDKPRDWGHLRNPVILLIKKGKMAVARGEYREAEMHFHAALRLNDDQLISKVIDEKKHLGAVIYIYDAMANLALQQKEYEKAFKIYKETIIGCLKAGIAKDSDAIIEISLKMASIYAFMGHKEEAIIGYDTCVEQQEKKMSENASEDTKALLGMIHQTYGRYLLAMNEYDKAQKHLERAEEVAIQVLGEDSENRASLLNDLATIQVMKGLYQEGEETLLKAVEIAEPKKMSELPALYCNLGALSLRASELNTAFTRCEKGLTYARLMNQKTSEKEALNCLQKVKEARK